MGHRRFQGGIASVARNRNAGQGEPESNRSFATRVTMIVAISCLGIITLWLTYRGISVLLTLFAGMLIAILFRTMAEPLMRYAKFPLWAAVVTAVIVTFGAFGLTGWLIAPSVSQQFNELSVRLPEAIDRVRGQFLSFEWTRWLAQHSGEAADGRKILQQVTNAFRITFMAGGAIVIVTFLALYMAAQPGVYIHGLVRLMPVDFRPRARTVLREIYRMLRVWLWTKLFTMLVTGIGIGIGLWLLKIPMALALGILAGVLEFIPTVGPLLSAIPAVLIALVIGPVAALKVAALYFLVQWVGNHVATPLIQQRKLSIPPAVTLALVALLGTFFGFGGLLLSGPLAVVIVGLVKMLYVEDVLEGGRRKRRRERREEFAPPEPRPLQPPASS
jgi:predicted PurR-regulated permease PerM